jgi:hypothetical protein
VNAGNILGTQKKIRNVRFVIPNMVKLKKNPKACLRGQGKKGAQTPLEVALAPLERVRRTAARLLLTGQELKKNLSKYGGKKEINKEKLI